MKAPAIRLLFLIFLPALLHAKAHWSAPLDRPDAWYATPEAQAVAASIVQYQTPSGVWPKNSDFSSPPTEKFLRGGVVDLRSATIDNYATTVPMTYLAKVVTAAGDKPSRASFERGFDYLLAAQYDSGGWPQYFPLRKGYYT